MTIERDDGSMIMTGTVRIVSDGTWERTRIEVLGRSGDEWHKISVQSMLIATTPDGSMAVTIVPSSLIYEGPGRGLASANTPTPDEDNWLVLRGQPDDRFCVFENKKGETVLVRSNGKGHLSDEEIEAMGRLMRNT